MLPSLRSSITITIGLAMTARFCIAADMHIAVVDASGQPIRDVVLIATAVIPGALRANGTPSKPAIMDQLNKEFVPEILVVRTGTQVVFPNGDAVAHQVYSFSATKRFSLPLYRGRPYPPETFDQAGIVTLGCNIHDHMVGYIVVTDSPYFAQSNEQGRATLQTLASGNYRVSAWHPRFNEAVAEQSITIADNAAHITFKLTKAMRPNPRRATTPRLRDY